MRYSILTAAMLSVVALLAIGTHAQDMGEAKPETQTLTGILIDTHCGAAMDEAKAAKHSIACATKEACAKSGYELVVGDKHYKFNDKGNDAAVAYLKTAKSTRVVVTGHPRGDRFVVESINVASDVEKKEAAPSPAK
jgi:hypothetical protein